MADAVNAIVHEAETNRFYSDQFQFSITAFIKGTKPLIANSVNYTQITNTVTTVKNMLDDGSDPVLGSGGTDINAALTYIKSHASTSGAGTSPSDRIKILIVITDGAQDNQSYDSTQVNAAHGWGWSSPDWDHKVQTMNSSICNSLVNQYGYTVSTLYLLYNNILSPYGGYNGQEEQLNRMNNQFPTALQSCASSSDLYGIADTPTQMQQALNALYANALNKRTPRIAY